MLRRVHCKNKCNCLDAFDKCFLQDNQKSYKSFILMRFLYIFVCINSLFKIHYSYVHGQLSSMVKDLNFDLP